MKTAHVIVRDDGQYVAKPGSQHSYTKRFEDARIYPSRDAAIADLCPDNERVQPISVPCAWQVPGY